MKRVHFSFAGLTFQIDCHDGLAAHLVSNNFASNGASFNAGAAYAVHKTGDEFILETGGDQTYRTETDADFLYALEKEITIQAQIQRPDLYFVHGAAIGFEGSAVLLIGEPGAGKSTLTWALLHHGFDYLSDELAPIDLNTLEVYPYPHAICLKKEPPQPYRLPQGALRTSRTIHIPNGSMPGKTLTDPLPVRFLFFVKYDASAAEPSIAEISPSEGAARLYSQTLNSLAHAGFGLQQAISIAKTCRCFVLGSASAKETCLAVAGVLKGQSAVESRTDP